MTERSSVPRRIGYALAVFPSPTETFIAREIEALKHRGFEVVVFAIRRPENGVDQYLSTAETLASCEYLRPDRPFSSFIANIASFVCHPFRYLSALGVFVGAGARLEPAAFARLLYHFHWGIAVAASARRRGVEHLHCHFAAGCNAGLAANLFAGTPFSFTAHASGDVFVKPVLLDQKIQAAKAVVAVCEYTKRYLDSVTAFAYTAKLHRVYNGIDPSEAVRMGGTVDAEDAANNMLAGRAHLVSVGSLVGVKGHATLIDVCRVLVAARIPVRCTIVGSGPERSVLERKISEASLKEVVELAGLRSLGEVYGTMRTADVFVLLSEIGVNGYRDGFPTVLLEAMAMALPVVSTWISGIPEIVENETTGFLVPERDVSAASEAIRRLLGDSTLRHRMGAAGRERATRMFALDRTADQLAALFRGVLPSASLPLATSLGDAEARLR